jgi:hypothetical protein
MGFVCMTGEQGVALVLCAQSPTVRITMYPSSDPRFVMSGNRLSSAPSPRMARIKFRSMRSIYRKLNA